MDTDKNLINWTCTKWQEAITQNSHSLADSDKMTTPLRVESPKVYKKTIKSNVPKHQDKCGNVCVSRFP